MPQGFSMGGVIGGNFGNHGNMGGGNPGPMNYGGDD